MRMTPCYKKTRVHVDKVTLTRFKTSQSDPFWLRSKVDERP